MDFAAHIQLVGFEGRPVNVKLDLEAYSLRESAWRSASELLKPFNVTPRQTNSKGRYQISFDLKEPAYLKLFGATAAFRLVVLSSNADAKPSLVVASERIVSVDGRFDLDFGTALYLGEHEFVLAGGEAGVCSGIALASDDQGMAAAQRRFYAQPHAIEQITAAHEAAEKLITELRLAQTASDKALAECRANVARLTRDNAALTSKVDTGTTERVELAKQLTAATARVDSTVRALEACTVERERLATQAKTQADALASARTDLEACAKARAALADELEQSRADADASREQLEALEAEFRSASWARVRAEAELAETVRQVAEITIALAEASAARDESHAAAVELRQRATIAEQASIEAADRLLRAEAEQELRIVELTELRERAAGGQSEVFKLKDQLIAESARATVAVQQLAAVREQHHSEAPAGDLIANLAQSLGNVNRELISGAVPYRLGRTDIRLKAVLSGDGSRLYLPDVARLTGDLALSEINFELMPDGAPAAPADEDPVVPDLLGLTETAVIRVLSSLFLKAEKAVETISGAPEKHGRALRQAPAAGAPAVRGQSVLVVYGTGEDP